MGCDIHFYVERREGDKWVSCDKWKTEDGEQYVDYDDYFYKSRNYDLFAILADVRNGRGFAGVKTGEGFVPISQPRGIPRDACKQYKERAKAYGCDGHSHSFFTVAELLEYDWTQVVCKQGWVDSKTFEEWDRMKGWNPAPESYCGSVGGGSVQHISNDEMRAYIKTTVGDARGSQWQERVATLNPSIYTLVEWTQPYHDRCKEFLSSTLPRLWRLGKPEDVRIVFFFDN